MADGIDEVGAIQRVEVELGDALIDEAAHLLSGNGGRNEIARLLVVVEALESMAEPFRDARAGLGGKARDLLEIMDGNETRNDGNIDPARSHAVEEAEIDLVVEKELRDRARRPR